MNQLKAIMKLNQQQILQHTLTPHVFYIRICRMETTSEKKKHIVIYLYVNQFRQQAANMKDHINAMTKLIQHFWITNCNEQMHAVWNKMSVRSERDAINIMRDVEKKQRKYNKIAYRQKQTTTANWHVASNFIND